MQASSLDRSPEQANSEMNRPQEINIEAPLNQETENKKYSSSEITTSTPMRPKGRNDNICSVDDIGLPIIGYKEAEQSVFEHSENNRDSQSSALLSHEAQEILNTTPELLSGQLSLTNRNLGLRENYSNMNASNMSIPQHMASQMSLDSRRLGNLHEERRLLSGDSAVSESQQVAERMNDVSLFAELSDQEPSFLGDASSVGNFSAVGKEMETIIKENEELLSAK